MKLTNNYGLPDPVYRAILSFQQEYEDSHKEYSDISVTTLIGPPQINELLREHGDLEEDASERLYALDGQAIHLLLERGAGPGDSIEERITAAVGPWMVSGQYDRFNIHSGLLQDYKNVFVKEASFGLKESRVQQLNCLAELMRRSGYEVKKLEAFCKFRDHSVVRAANDPSYPQRGFMVVPVEMWPREKALEYMEERVLLHKAARDGNYVPCSEDDRWHQADKWAVMKKGRKSALRVLDSHEESIGWIPVNVKDGDLHKVYINHRPGQDTRCDYYCPVSSVCPQKKG